MIDRCARLVGLFVTLALAGCAASRPDFEAHVADDINLRHPIELRQGWQELALAANGPFDAQVSAQIGEFVRDWRHFGEGPLFLRMPGGVQTNKQIQTQANRLRTLLAGQGAEGKITYLRDAMAETGRAPMFTLSFARMKAQVVTRCGRWPDNLASSADAGFENRAYANFGCAYQSMIAAQTDDPRDFMAPRAQAPIDGQMRVRAIDALRNGSDPSAAWGQKGAGGS